jgi:hypothetical protein
MSDVPLREHVEALRQADIRLNDQRFRSQEKAIAVAEANAERWRANANEWRAAMTDREQNFFSRSMGNVVLVLSAAAALIAILSHFAK